MLTSFQDVAQGLASHLNTIHLLSFGIAGFTALMMWLAWRHIRSEKWIWCFAWFFLLLAGRYLWSLLFWLPLHMESTAALPSANELVRDLGMQVLSTANNLFALAAANDIKNERLLAPRRWWVLIPKRWWVVAGISFLLAIASFTAKEYPTAGFL